MEEKKNDFNIIKDKINDTLNDIGQYADSKQKKKICGVSLRRIFGYIIVYSFLGYVVEVLYGLITKGVIESRQSFIYGPFCAIYGVGAVLMLLSLKKVNKKNRILNFLIAGVVGCALEYLVSWFGETFMHVKWWDYSDYFLNVNGRVCLYFGLFWGLLGLILLEQLNPRVDALIETIKKRHSKAMQNVIVILANVFLVIDCTLTIIAMDLFQTRAIHDHDINVRFKDYYVQHYNHIYKDAKTRSNIELTWGDELMIKTFPNLKITNLSGDTVYLSEYYPEIQNYYFKVFDSKSFNVVDKD